MKITIFNIKGGQGKSSIALNLALSMDANIITNDIITPIEDILPSGRFLKIEKDKDFPNIPDEYDLDIIYDLGGWIDTRTKRVIEESNLIIIPMINETINNKASLVSLQNILQLNKNILVIVNRSEKDDKDCISYLINQLLKEYNYNINIPILEIKKTTAFNKMIDNKESIQNIVKKDPLLAFSYNKVLNQFNEIVNFISNYRNR